MSLPHRPAVWARFHQLIHWATAALILLAWLFVELHENYPKGSDARLAMMQLHQSVGLTVFVLFFLRLISRFTLPVPAALPQKKWQHALSAATHISLYVLLLAMPLAALLAAQFSAKPIEWFGAWAITPVLSVNPTWAHALMEWHEDVFWPLLMIVMGLHIAAVLWHQRIKNDRIMQRMVLRDQQHDT